VFRRMRKVYADENDRDGPMFRGSNAWVWELLRRIADVGGV
jgi:hypothetical protein